jgi:NADPH2:quinone reductase
VINYRQQDVVTEIRKIVPKGVDTIVEVAPAANAAIDAAVLGRLGSGMTRQSKA